MASANSQFNSYYIFYMKMLRVLWATTSLNVFKFILFFSIVSNEQQIL